MEPSKDSGGDIRIQSSGVQDDRPDPASSRRTRAASGMSSRKPRTILGSSATDDRLSDGAWSLHGERPVRILLVGDDGDDAVLLKRTLGKSRRAVRRPVGDKRRRGAGALATGWYDATLVDTTWALVGVELIRDATAAGCVTPLIC
jgi:hypothetical protein